MVAKINSLCQAEIVESEFEDAFAKIFVVRRKPDPRVQAARDGCLRASR